MKGNRQLWIVLVVLVLAACSGITGVFSTALILKTAASPQDIEGAAGFQLGPLSPSFNFKGYKPVLNSTTMQVYVREEEVTVKGMSLTKKTSVGVETGVLTVVEVAYFAENLRDFQRFGEAMEQSLRKEYDPAMFPKGRNKLMQLQQGAADLYDAQGDQLSFAAANGEVNIRVSR